MLATGLIAPLSVTETCLELKSIPQVWRQLAQQRVKERESGRESGGREREREREKERERCVHKFACVDAICIGDCPAECEQRTTYLGSGDLRVID